MFRGLDSLLLPDHVFAAIRVPTLFVWGGRDAFGGESTAKAVVARMPTATLELMPDAGHAPWLDDLDRCVVLVKRFLGRSD